MRRPPLAPFLLLVTPALFASNMLTARWLEGALPPVGTAFWRWTLTFVLLLPLTGRALWRERAAALREAPHLLVLGALGMGVCGAPVYLAAETTTATNMGLIYAASPVMIVLLERFLVGTRISAAQIAGVALCLSGVVVIILRGDVAALAALAFTTGDLWILFAATGWALYSVLLKHWGSTLSLTVRFAAIVLAGVIVMLPFYMAENALGRAMPADLRAAASVLFLALSPGLCAYLAYGRLIAELGPARSSVLMYLIPLYSVLLAALLLGERLALHHLAGAALIAPGLFLATRSARPRAA